MAREVTAERGCVEAGLLDRYLQLLGVPRKEPGLEALSELVFAHLTRVPFENISKLYRCKRQRQTALPALPQFLEGIEQCHFGGTCYSNNFHFYTLLADLGYDVKLCGADMSTPDVHMVSVVRIDGREYLVDAGYAAPFLSPMPLDLSGDYVLHLGRDQYLLKPKDQLGRSRLELYRDGTLKHGYLINPRPRTIEDFQPVISDSFRSTATFLNSILLARFWRDRSLVIHNLMLIESRGSQCQTRPLRRNEVAAEIHRQFGMPPEIVAEAIENLHDLQDAWGDAFLGGRTSEGGLPV
jgi:N-hydroxyarylamine O-acetyltransferase